MKKAKERNEEIGTKTKLRPHRNESMRRLKAYIAHSLETLADSRMLWKYQAKAEIMRAQWTKPNKKKWKSARDHFHNLLQKRRIFHWKMLSCDLIICAKDRMLFIHMCMVVVVEIWRKSCCRWLKIAEMNKMQFIAFVFGCLHHQFRSSVFNRFGLDCFFSLCAATMLSNPKSFHSKHTLCLQQILISIVCSSANFYSTNHCAAVVDIFCLKNVSILRTKTIYKKK